MAQKGVKTPTKQSPKPQPKAQSKTAGRVARWWRETQGELRKVNWPTRQEAWRLTRVVLIVMAIMAAFLGLLDFIFGLFMGLILA